MARKLKMTKKCIAARRCYRARKAGVPARRKTRKNVRKKRGGSVIYDRLGGKQLKRNSGLKYVIQGKKRYPLKSRTRRISPGKYNLRTGKMGSGLRGRKRRRKGRGRGRGRGRAKGAGFFEDLGKSFEWVGNAVLTALPFVAAVL